MVGCTVGMNYTPYPPHPTSHHGCDRARLHGGKHTAVDEEPMAVINCVEAHGHEGQGYLSKRGEVGTNHAPAYSATVGGEQEGDKEIVTRARGARLSIFTALANHAPEESEEEQLQLQQMMDEISSDISSDISRDNREGTAQPDGGGTGYGSTTPPPASKRVPHGEKEEGDTDHQLEQRAHFEPGAPNLDCDGPEVYMHEDGEITEKRSTEGNMWATPPPLRPALVDNDGALTAGPTTETARVLRPVPTYPAPGGSNGPDPLGPYAHPPEATCSPPYSPTSSEDEDGEKAARCARWAAADAVLHQYSPVSPTPSPVPQ